MTLHSMIADHARLVLAVVGAAAASAGGPLFAAGAQDGGTARITHVGIVVRDVERSARAWAELVGSEPPAIATTPAGGGGGTARVARLRLGNVTIELLQPVGDGPGSYRDFLATWGQGVHHVGLQAAGGALAAAGVGARVIDVRPWLGLQVETMPPAAQERLFGGRAPPPVAASLAQPTCVTHLGLVVRDIERSRQALADLIGVDPPSIRQFDDAAGPAAFTIFNLANASIELLQQLGDGGGAYADFLAAHGPRAHHVGLHLRPAAGGFDLAAQTAWLERRGPLAVAGGGFAYVDLRPLLGLHVEALSDAVNEQVYPHPHDAP